MKLLDGKKISGDSKDEIAQEVAVIKARNEKVPHLAAVIVGTDGASLTYVGSKVKACERVGFTSTLKQFPESITEEELLEVVADLNADTDIDGYIVQLPLPKQKVILEKWFFKLGFFFWSTPFFEPEKNPSLKNHFYRTRFLEPDSLNQIPRTRFL